MGGETNVTRKRICIITIILSTNKLWSGRRNEFAKETNVNNKNNFIHKCLWIRKKVVSLQPERLKIEDYVQI